MNKWVRKRKHISATFAAVADPSRRRILVGLSNRVESLVTALAKPFRISPRAVSRHLRVLENARLIERRRQGRAHLIRAQPDGLKKAQEWINQCTAGWEVSFDALSNLLKKPQRKEKMP